MKRAAIIALVVLVLGGGFALADWYVLGGPIAERAIGKCANALEGDDVLADQVVKSTAVEPKYNPISGMFDGLAGGGGGKPKKYSAKQARDRCEDAYRRGDLTIRGGING